MIKNSTLSSPLIKQNTTPFAH